MNTEQIATSRPWGCRLWRFPFLGQPKKEIKAARRDSRTSDPSPAKTRKRPFQSNWEPKRFWYRCCSVSHKLRQKRSGSFARAWQKAASVTTFSGRCGQAVRSQSQARISPWVIDSEWRLTDIMSQQTTSGSSTRLFRLGAQSQRRAIVLKSSGVRMAWNCDRPNERRVPVRERGEPMNDITSLHARSGGWAVVHDHPVSTPSIGLRRLFLLAKMP